MKIQKQMGGRGVGSGGGGRVGGQGRCDQRSEFFVKIQKKDRGGVGSGRGVGLGWGIRMDLNEELKFL